VFVIDKIDALDQPVAPQIAASLTRLQMDYTDLCVFYNLSTREAWSHITAPGGGMEQLDQAIGAGKTRFKGISSHSPEVLEAAIPSGLVDEVLVGGLLGANTSCPVLPAGWQPSPGLLTRRRLL
jgi:diketogulonate reductase-like aldo/keto reductase